MDTPSPATALDRVARIGFVVKGVVYILIAALSARALSVGREAMGPAGVIEALLDAPLSQFLLVATGLGLGCYGVWRLVGAAIFPHDPESGAKGWGKRIGFATTGLVHLLLGGYAVYLALGYDAGGGEGAEQTLTAQAMSYPGGVWAVGLLGVVFFAVAAFQVYQAFGQDPLEPHQRGEMSEAEQTGALAVARLGLSARGVVFAILGGFILLAAWRTDPEEVRGLGEALGEVAAQPAGWAAFLLVAAGFVAYGVYCFSLARYARFETSLAEDEGHDGTA